MKVCANGAHPHVSKVVESVALLGVVDKAQSSMAKGIGRMILECTDYHGSLVYFFQLVDKDRSGFLNGAELQEALKKLPKVGAQITATDVAALVLEMENMGVVNNRVSLIEFLQTLGNRELAAGLQAVM